MGEPPTICNNLTICDNKMADHLQTLVKPGARRRAPGFLKLILCGLSVCVCVCVCVRARGY